MNKAFLSFLAAMFLFCLSAISYAAFDTYSGTAPGLKARFTFKGQTTVKYRNRTALNGIAFKVVTTFKTRVFAPRAASRKKNIAVSRDTGASFIGSQAGGRIYVKFNKAQFILSPMNQVLTSVKNISISNFEGVVYGTTGTVDWDGLSETGTGTGEVFRAEIGGKLTFIPNRDGSKAVMKLQNLGVKRAFFNNLSSGAFTNFTGTAIGWQVSVPTIPLVLQIP